MALSKESARVPIIDRSLCGHKDAITSVAFHPFPAFLASSTRRRKQTTSMDQIATSSLDGTLNIWNYSNDRKDVRVYRFQGHEGPCHNVRYSPSGSLVASCSSDKTVRIWLPKALTNSESVVLRGHSAPVKDVDFSSGQGQGRSLLLSCSDDKTLRIWDLPENSFKSCLVGHSNWINSCRFMPNSVQIAASGSDDGTIRLWDVSKSSNLVTYNVNACTGSFSKRNGTNTRTGNAFHSVRKIEFHPSGSLLAASLGNGFVEIYDLRTDHLIHTFHDKDQNVPAPSNTSNGVAFHPHGNHLMTGHNDGESFSFWDLRSNKRLFTVNTNGSNAKTMSSKNPNRPHPNSCCAFSNDGSKFATAGCNGKQAFVWTPLNTAHSYEAQEDNNECENDYVERSRSHAKGPQPIDEKVHVEREEYSMGIESTVKQEGNSPHEETTTFCEEKQNDVVENDCEISPPLTCTTCTSTGSTCTCSSPIDEVLSQINVLTQTVILLEQRLSIQEEAIKKLATGKE